VGYGSLILSMVLYLVIFALPFFDGETQEKVALAGVLYISSYAVMFFGGAVLGPEIMDKLKSTWKKWFRRKSDQSLLSDQENEEV
jgi:hypothetical protein